MADATVKREVEDEEAAGDAADAAAADLQTSPAQAAGRRTRKPVQPLGGVVTRRTSARQVASSASRGNVPTDSSSSPRQASRATRQAGPRTRGTPAAAAAGAAAEGEDAAAPAAAATSAATSAPTTPRKGGWKRKKSLDTDELSTSEPEMEHDDSDSDPVWVPDAATGGSSVSKAAAVADSSSTVGEDSVAEPAVKVARRGKPAKGAKGKAGGSRKGAAAAAAAAKKPPNGARSEAEGGAGGGEGGAGGGGGGRRGAARKAVEAPPSIDLAVGSEVLPESLQLKVQVPGEGEEPAHHGAVARTANKMPAQLPPAASTVRRASSVCSDSAAKRDYTRRPSAAANAWRMTAPVVVTVTEASPAGTPPGELQPGDYIMAMADVHRSRPPIWRIEGRTLLQRFEVIETGEETLLYRNSSSFSAWNPLEQSKYANITVRVHSNSRNASVVEVLEIHAPPNSSLAKNGGPEARSSACGGDSLPSLEEPFEVYLQTLLSHVLDPNFLAEVHRENDEYFLANLQTVDGENERRAARLRRSLWGFELCRALTSFPRVRLLAHSQQQPGIAKDEGVVASLSCEGCGEGTVARVAEFSGELYNKLDLSESQKPPISSVKEEGEGEDGEGGGKKSDKRTFLLCASCAEPIPTYSHLHHYKLHAFHRCRDKIERLREDEKVTESHIILERCLQDETWVNQMYADLQKLWRTCVPESS